MINNRLNECGAFQHNMPCKLFEKCHHSLFQQAEFQDHDYWLFRNLCCSTGKDCGSHLSVSFPHIFGVFRILHQNFVFILFTFLWHSVCTNGLLETYFGQFFLIFEEFGWSFAPIANFHKHLWILNILASSALGVCLYTYLSFFWSNEIFEGIAYKFIRQFWRNKSQLLFERPPPGEKLHLNPLKEMGYSFANILQ